MQHCVARRTNGKRNMQLEMGQARMRRVASRRAASHCNFVLFASTSFNFVFFSAYFSFTLLSFSAYLFLSLFPFLSPVHRFAVTVSLPCLSFCSSFNRFFICYFDKLDKDIDLLRFFVSSSSFTSFCLRLCLRLVSAVALRDRHC